MTEQSEVPVRGVVMIFINHEGRAVCEATDFDMGSYGGFNLKESQTIRCKRDLARVVLKTYASDDLVRAVTDYEGENILQRLVREHKCSVKTVFVGHERERYDEDVV